MAFFEVIRDNVEDSRLGGKDSYARENARRSVINGTRVLGIYTRIRPAVEDNNVRMSRGRLEISTTQVHEQLSCGQVD